MDPWLRAIQFVIGLVSALGLAGLIVNTIATGRDVPGGLLTLMLAVIGAVYGVDAIQSGRRKDD